MLVCLFNDTNTENVVIDPVRTSTEFFLLLPKLAIREYITFIPMS
jgi:hypothetical protein